MKVIEFIFENTEDAKQFVIFLIESGIVNLNLYTSPLYYNSVVKYEIDIFDIDINDSIQFGKEFLKEKGIIKYQIFS